MSRIRADIIVNRDATGPVVADQGIVIPVNKKISIGSDSGSTGQFLSVTSTGLSWVNLPVSYTLPTATASTLGGIKIGTGLSIDAGGVVTATGGGSYSLPTATASTLGGIKIGTGLSIDAGGVVTATGGGSGITDIVLDLTPQLGGNLDLNSKNITGIGNIDVTGDVTGKGLKLSYNNPTSLSTPGTSGEIRKIDGAPFWYDGVEWREFFLINATAVTQVADTDWDKTILRCNFETDANDLRFGDIGYFNGGASISSLQYKFGTKSLRINGVGSTLLFQPTPRPEYNFEGEWTIEGWYYFNQMNYPPSGQTNGNSTLWSIEDANGNNIISLGWILTSQLINGNPYFQQKLTYNTLGAAPTWTSTLSSYTSDQPIQPNLWHHIAVQRSSAGRISIIVNGERQGTYIDNSITDISREYIYIGKNFYTSSVYPGGFIDDFRISTKARYSSTQNSIVPTTTFPISGSTTTIIPTNSSNTFGISAETATGTNAKLRLSKSNSTQDDILLVGAGGLTIARTDDSTLTFTGGGGTFTISSSGSSDYVFAGSGIVSGNTNDPVLYLYRGFTYTFVNTTGTDHPFAIRTASITSGGSAYTSGVSGSQSGIQIFTVPMNAPSTLYYQCTIHSGMGNVINIV